MNYESRIRTLQWKWSAAHTTVKRYENLLREFRVTSLSLFVIVVSSAFFLPQKTNISNIMFGFSAIFWACTYFVTLGPNILTSISGKFRSEEKFDDWEGEFEELAIEIEKVTYVQRKYYRYVRMSSMLIIYGLIMMAFAFVFLLMGKC